MGPFNKEFREIMLNRDFYGDCVARSIPVTKNMNVSKFLVEDSEVRWHGAERREPSCGRL